MTLCEIHHVSLENKNAHHESATVWHWSDTESSKVASLLHMRENKTYKIVTLCWSVACRAEKWSDFSLEFDFGFLLWNDDHGTKLKLYAQRTEHKSTSSTSWITAVLWRFPELVCTSNTVLKDTYNKTELSCTAEGGELVVQHHTLLFWNTLNLMEET